MGEIFTHAGRGLAEAHAAGIVHRDFKPQNVMVGKDGRVRVMDFGLATAPLGESMGAAAAPQAVPGGQPAALPGLTRTGSLMGTPLYMAPEQFKGELADERSDQFGFCVALYEGLYGERPFPSANFSELTAAVLAGRVRDRPARTNVPSWLRAVVVRGLAARREDRYPSMSALLEQLERNPARRRRWLAGAALTGLAAVAIGAGVSWKHARAANLCRQPAARLAEIWEPPGVAGTPRHDAVRRAFLGVDKPFAADSLSTVTRAMDTYAARWNAAYSDACLATHVRNEQSTQALDLRTSCLDQALGAFKTLADLLVTADAALVSSSVVAVGQLPDLDRCNDPERLRSSARLPTQPGAREQVGRLRARMAEVKMLGDAGREADAAREGQRIVVDARAIDFPPVLAEGLVALATIHAHVDSRAAVNEALEAFWIAMRLGQDEIAERAAHVVGMVNAFELANFADAALWLRMAETLLERLGAGQDLEWSWYWEDYGGLAFREGKMTDARVALEKGLDLKRKMLGSDHADVGRSMCSLAAICLEIPDYACAFKWAAEGAGVMKKGAGDRHPDMGLCLQNEGEALSGLKRFREALDAHRRAQAIWAESLGGDQRVIGYALNGMGVAQLGLGDAPGARKTLEEALALREKKETDPTPLAETRFALARALWIVGERGRALSLAREARDAYARLPKEMAPRLRAVDAWLASRA